MKKTSKESFDKKLIIWVLVLLIPIICVIVAMAVKSPKEENKTITRDTYVHVFYVKDTDVKDEVKDTLAEIDAKYKVVYHDITSDNDLYKKVLDYLKITEKVYNPLIMINDNYFTEEYDKYSLENAIKEANKTYSKEKLDETEILKYNVVDRLNAGEEVLEKED